MTLAEIIEEGENAEQAYRDAKAFSSAEIGAGDWCHRFYVEHGPRLLAVAKAAVEMLDATVAGLDDKSDAATTRFLLAMDRLDAAVRGDGKEKG